MTLNEPRIYHIYKRGNNQQSVFFPGKLFLFPSQVSKYIKSVSTQQPKSLKGDPLKLCILQYLWEKLKLGQLKKA
jgi:hypothetical protein